jgi:hypothetical protein
VINELGTHGFGHIQPDDYRIPQFIWNMLVIEPSGCWTWSGSQDTNPQIAMATRLLAVPRKALLAVVPTCGNATCANPAHLCVTRREQDEAERDAHLRGKP